MQVGRQGDAGREDALALLAFALAVELLPPLAHVLQLGLVGGQNLDLLALLVEHVAHGRIDGRGILGKGHAVSRGPLHVLRTAHQLGDVDAGGGQRQQSDRGEHREAAAHVVRNDEGGVALVRREGLQGAARLVRYGDDALGGLLLAVALLDLGLDDAEGDGGFGGRARFRDHDGGYRVLLQGVEQLGGVILRNVLASKEHDGLRLFLVEQLEGVAHRLQHRLGAQVGAADSDADDHFGLLAQLGSLRADGFDLCGVYRRGEVHPAQKVVAGTLLRVQQGVGLFGLALHFGRDCDARLRNVQFDCVHKVCFFI